MGWVIMQCLFKAILFIDSAAVVSLKKLLLQVTEDVRISKMHLTGSSSTAPFTVLHGVAVLKVCVMSETDFCAQRLEVESWSPSRICA
jgi:hypothetical protein